MKTIKSNKKASFYKCLFCLDKVPVVLSQCCEDDPTHKKSCFGMTIGEAQKRLDRGYPVVLECFGRRTVRGDNKRSFGTFFKKDMIIVYVPGEKIDRKFFKKCQEINKKNLFDTGEFA